MPSSSKILRGLDIQGWRICYPRPEGKNTLKSSGQESVDLSATKTGSVKKAAQPEAFLTEIRGEGEKLRREILAEAVTEARLLGEKARREGYEKGYQQGEEAVQELIAEARQTLERASRERQEILAQAEPEIIRLSLSIAEKILDYTVNMDSRCILALIARGLQVLPAGERVYIKVNPLDEKICRENFYGLQELLKEGTTLEIIADGKVPSGNCRVESEEVEAEMLWPKELQILGNKLLELAASSGLRDFEETD